MSYKWRLCYSQKRMYVSTCRSASWSVAIFLKDFRSDTFIVVLWLASVNCNSHWCLGFWLSGNLLFDKSWRLKCKPCFFLKKNKLLWRSLRMFVNKGEVHTKYSSQGLLTSSVRVLSAMSTADCFSIHERYHSDKAECGMKVPQTLGVNKRPLWLTNSDTFVFRFHVHYKVVVIAVKQCLMNRNCRMVPTPILNRTLNESQHKIAFQ